MISDIEKSLIYQFDPKLITFRLYISDIIPDIILHDEKRIKQILMNLIYNAFKYTEKGFVLVVVDGAASNSPSKSSNRSYLKSVPSININFSISDSG